MGMFDSYYGISNDAIPYIKKDIRPGKFIPPYEFYDNQGNFKGYMFNKGDAVILEFNTTGEVQFEDGTWEDAETYFKNKFILFRLFDYRQSIVFEFKITADTNIKILLDSETTEQLQEGVYTFKYILLDEEMGIIHTLLPNENIENCVIYVK